MMVEMTYVALRPLRVRGQTRVDGDLVPEATTWHNVGAYLSTGKLAAVPRNQVDQDALAEAEEAWEADAREREAKREEPKPAYQGNEEETPSGASENVSEFELDDELEQYHTGSGWYELPGADKKLRRDEAEAFLAEDETEE